MPRISRLSTLHTYKLPKAEDGHFIGGVSIATPTELLEIADAPFAESRFSKFVYSVSNNRLRTYTDEFFTSFIENVSLSSSISDEYSTEKVLTSNELIKCLMFETSVRTPLATVHEYKFCRGTDLVGGIGIYSLNSKFGIGDNTLKTLLGKVAQYHLESLNLSLGIMTAIIQPDNKWRLVLGQIRIHKYTKERCASVDFFLFDPAAFVSAVFTKQSLKDTDHESFRLYVELSGDLSYYKSY